jgi:hypothetical protein
MTMVVLYLKQLDANFLAPREDFNPRSVNIGFVLY